MDPNKETPTEPIDIETVRNQAREAAQAEERARVIELTKTGEKFDAQDLARQFIDNGGSVHDLNAAILERKGIDVVKAEDPAIGLTEQEARDFSFTRLLAVQAYKGDPLEPSLREAAAFELEACAAAAAQLKKDSRGSVVPFDVLVQKRAHTVGTATAGGNLVETELLDQSFIDKLENALAMRQLGITMLSGLNGNIAIPRQTGGASHFWLAENGNPTESSATFDQIAMTPKTVGAYTEISRRLLLQSSIGIESFVQNELALRLALAIDSAAISGTGASNQPTGVLNYAGVGDVSLGTPNGGALDWDGIVDLETEVANANADVGSLAYLTNAKVRGKAKKTFIDPGSGERIWDSRSGETPLNGYRTVISNQVPSNLVEGTSGATLSAVIFGNWADLIIGMWGGLDIQVNPYSLDTTGAIRVTSFQDVDIQIRHPESFAAIQDAITT